MLENGVRRRRLRSRPIQRASHTHKSPPGRNEKYSFCPTCTCTVDRGSVTAAVVVGGPINLRKRGEEAWKSCQGV